MALSVACSIDWPRTRPWPERDGLRLAFGLRDRGLGEHLLVLQLVLGLLRLLLRRHLLLHLRLERLGQMARAEIHLVDANPILLISTDRFF